MANYLTTDEVTARVGGAALYLQLTDDDGDGTTDTDVEDWALGAIDDLINGTAARGGYAVPLVAADSAYLNGFMLDIINYKLKARRGTPSVADEKQYNDAMKLLEKVATGDLVLPSGAGATTGGFANLNFDGNKQQLNRTTLRDL